MAVTAPRDDKQSQGDVVTMKMAAVKLYAGTLLCVNTSGYVTNAADTADFQFAGVAADTVDNSGGSAGDKKIDVYTEGTFEVKFSGTATQATVGQPAYAVDNETVAAAGTTTNDVPVGKVVEFISASLVRIKIGLAVTVINEAA